MGGMLFVTQDTVLHCNLVVLIRNRTIGACCYFECAFWLFVVLRGDKPARARQAPLWGAAERKKD